MDCAAISTSVVKQMVNRVGETRRAARRMVKSRAKAPTIVNGA
jgi:hypothetical protein